MKKKYSPFCRTYRPTYLKEIWKKCTDVQWQWWPSILTLYVSLSLSELTQNLQKLPSACVDIPLASHQIWNGHYYDSWHPIPQTRKPYPAPTISFLWKAENWITNWEPGLFKISIYDIISLIPYIVQTWHWKCVHRYIIIWIFTCDIIYLIPYIVQTWHWKCVHRYIIIWISIYDIICLIPYVVQTWHWKCVHRYILIWDYHYTRDYIIFLYYNEY